MASFHIEIQSDSSKESEPVVADPAQNSTNTVTVDNIFTASEHGDLEKLRKFVEQDRASLSSPNNDGDYALHLAAENNHSEIVRYIVEHGGDVNVVNNLQQTALHCAADGGWISVADVLLQNGAHVEASDVNGHKAVHYAAGKGKASFLNYIVAKYDVDLDVPDNEGMIPLHWAAMNNHPETVLYIIEHGGDVNAVSNSKLTALHCTADGGWISVADVLLQNGAQVEAADVNGRRAVHYAAEKGKASFLNYIFAKYNVDFDVQDNEGMIPLHWAAMNNHPETVLYIIEHGGDVNAVSNSKQTALHCAADGGWISVADVLLQNGAQVEAADVNGRRAVHYAAGKGKASFLNYIFAKYNVDFDVPDNEGMIPLHWAAMNNHPETVLYIIEHGGDVNVVSNSKQTALHCAADGGWISVADVLLQNGAHVEDADVNGLRAVHYAAKNGKTSFLKHIVSKYNADLDVPDNEGRSPLHWAAMENHHEIVQYIIEHGGDVNAIDNNKKTALHWVAMQGSISIADALLLNGAHVEDVDVDGKRAIHFAAGYGQTSFLKHIIVKYNADFDVSDNFGVRPLLWAMINNQIEIAQYIIEHGGDVNAINNLQQTTLHLAAARGSISVADMLLKNGAHVEAVDEDGNRAVHFAAKDGQTTFLKHIVAKYNAHFDVTNNEGMTPLHWAADYNHHETVQYIIEHGGDVNAVNNFQQTALHRAVIGGYISVADLLLHNGAHVEAVDGNGHRAVHFAARDQQPSLLNHIVSKYNANFDVPDNNGSSPLHWAAGHGRVDTITWLLSKNASLKRQDIHGRTPLHNAALGGKIDAFMVLREAATEKEIMMKDNEGNTAIQLSPILTSKALYEECKNSSMSYFAKTPAGTNRRMIIAIQGDAYTGKTQLAFALASRIKCPVISLDNFLDATEPTDERDTLISNTFNIIAEIVKTQIILGLSVIVDSPLSRLSHLRKLARAAYNTRTKLVIIECKPKNEYAYQLKFEDSAWYIYSSRWHKPPAVWPLPKVPRDYTDEDIPPGLSKLIVDTNDHFSPCRLLEAIFDLASCDEGHKTNYHEDWVFIHQDKKEQFTCPCPGSKRYVSYKGIGLHDLKFHEVGPDDNSETLCGVCDFLVDGPHYTCMDCPLTLDQSCAELARGGKKHFVPETFPIFMSRGQHWTYTFPVESPCAECRKDGKGFSCKCMHCLFESHLKSQLVPTVVRHKAHDKFLTLWLNSDAGDSMFEYTCLACREDGHCAAYFLSGGSFYHPQCALLPPSLSHSHGGYTHELEMITNRVEKEEDYLCDCCLKKMDPSMWYYYCIECNISIHLDCAFLDFDTGRPITEARS